MKSRSGRPRRIVIVDSSLIKWHESDELFKMNVGFRKVAVEAVYQQMVAVVDEMAVPEGITSFHFFGSRDYFCSRPRRSQNTMLFNVGLYTTWEALQNETTSTKVSEAYV